MVSVCLPSDALLQHLPDLGFSYLGRGVSILKPWDNQCIFHMEMFVLSYANVLCIYLKHCLQVGSSSWLRTYLTKQYFILRYCCPNLCKQNYLYGNLSFYKIQVNHFMAQDEPFGAKIIPKCLLWVRGLVPFWVLRHSFINRLLVTIYGEGNGIPLQYPCLENPTDGRAWKAAVHGVAEGQTQLSNFTLTFHFHALEKEMATCSSILAWRIPGTGEPGGLLSMGSHRVGHDWSDLAVAVAVTI